jgi:hypothetical protein
LTVLQHQSLDILRWEEIRSDALAVWRSPVPWGWLVFAKRVDGAGLAFYPDPLHDWTGSSASPTTNRQDSRKDNRPDIRHDQPRRRRKDAR